MTTPGEPTTNAGGRATRDSITDVWGAWGDPYRSLARSSVASSAPTRSLRATGWVGRGAGLPASSALDLISDKQNRWNAEGEPTIYVSGDPGLALVESGRHEVDLEDGLRVFQVQLLIPNALDLRDAGVRAALSLPDERLWILDRERTRAVAGALRRSREVDALIVPSAGALDTPDRYNVVVFADDRERIPELVAGLRPAGELCFDGSAADPAFK